MVGSQDHPTHIPGLAVADLSVCGSKTVKATEAGRSLKFLSTLAYMVGAFVSPLVPLFLFRLAVRRLDVTEPPRQRTDSVDGESSEEGEVYDMILERPEVRPVEDQVYSVHISRVILNLTTIVRFLLALLCISVRSEMISWIQNRNQTVFSIAQFLLQHKRPHHQVIVL